MKINVMPSFVDVTNTHQNVKERRETESKMIGLQIRRQS